MLRTPFNEGWRVRQKVSSFPEVTSAAREWVDVSLPHLPDCERMMSTVAAR